VGHVVRDSPACREYERARGGELVDPTVVFVRHPHISAGVGGDAGGRAELARAATTEPVSARIRTGFEVAHAIHDAPAVGLDEATRRRELIDPSVELVGDV